jgi:hypothetical protein
VNTNQTKPSVNGMRFIMLDRVDMIGDSFGRHVEETIFEFREEYGEEILPDNLMQNIKVIGEQLQDLYQAIGALDDVDE